MSREILKLAVGFKKFKERYFEEEKELYEKLHSEGQSPKTLVIGCSDSRVDPALLCSASPGDLFVVRNVANLVPPHEESTKGYHGVSSAIEFAVVGLKVENIIILGHSQCGGIRALVTSQGVLKDGFLQQWVKIAKNAKDKVQKAHPKASHDELCRHCEKEAILASIENLKSFPFVRAAMEERQLTLIPLYFDLEVGELLEYSESEATFKPLPL